MKNMYHVYVNSNVKNNYEKYGFNRNEKKIDGHIFYEHYHGTKKECINFVNNHIPVNAKYRIIKS
jgi:hypothetical protein